MADKMRIEGGGGDKGEGEGSEKFELKKSLNHCVSYV